MSKVLNWISTLIGIMTAAILVIWCDPLRGYLSKIEETKVFNKIPEYDSILSKSSIVALGSESSQFYTSSPKDWDFSVSKGCTPANICLKYIKSTTDNKIRFEGETIQIPSTGLSHSQKQFKLFGDIYSQLFELSRELPVFGNEVISLQFFILYNPQERDQNSIQEQGESVKRQIDQIKEEIQNMFKSSMESREVKFSFSLVKNKFKSEIYFDKEVIQDYERVNDFWRIKTKPTKNINIFVPPQEHKNSFIEYRSNYVISLKRNLLSQLKRIVFHQSKLKQIKDIIENNQQTVDAKFLVFFSKQLREYQRIKETSVFLKTVKYVNSNWKLRYKKEKLDDLTQIVKKLSGKNDDYPKDKDLAHTIYKLNREQLYDSVYVYPQFRLAFLVLFILPFMVPILKSAFTLLLRKFKAKVMGKKFKAYETPKVNFLFPIDWILKASIVEEPYK